MLEDVQEGILRRQVRALARHPGHCQHAEMQRARFAIRRSGKSVAPGGAGNLLCPVGRLMEGERRAHAGWRMISTNVHELLARAELAGDGAGRGGGAGLKAGAGGAALSVTTGSGRSSGEPPAQAASRLAASRSAESGAMRNPGASPAAGVLRLNAGRPRKMWL